ncbi:hypothetical protein ACTVZO_42700 [Streptomyces sp. IBSNAI002]|uniref:hypothetical protein n=1 Tax=Streptomyces sp. IBSNAI002 TaxID=3457500 RepID=UPI003FD60E7A
MTDTREALDRAVTALATGSDHTQSQSVRVLVSIALNEPAHRPQPLTALEDFTASNHGVRTDAVVCSVRVSSPPGGRRLAVVTQAPAPM